MTLVTHKTPAKKVMRKTLTKAQKGTGTCKIENSEKLYWVTSTGIITLSCLRVNIMLKEGFPPFF